MNPLGWAGAVHVTESDVPLIGVTAGAERLAGTEGGGEKRRKGEEEEEEEGRRRRRRGGGGGEEEEEEEEGRRRRRRGGGGGGEEEEEEEGRRRRRRKEEWEGGMAVGALRLVVTLDGFTSFCSCGRGIAPKCYTNTIAH